MHSDVQINGNTLVSTLGAERGSSFEQLVEQQGERAACMNDHSKDT